MEDITIAAPLQSPLIVPISSAGFIEIPPESNVIPLPINTMGWTFPPPL